MSVRTDPAFWIAELRSEGWVEAADVFDKLLAERHPITINEDAARWCALMNSGCIRILGYAGLHLDSDPRLSHMELGLWATFPHDKDLDEANYQARQLLTRFADNVRRLQNSETKQD